MPYRPSRNDAWTICTSKMAKTPSYQSTGKNVGSTTGAMPNATEIMANPVKTIEAHTPKAISDELRRACIAMVGYKSVGESRVMSVSNRLPEQ